ncbi:MAG: HIT family protein [Actinomycetota bacterium]
MERLFRPWRMSYVEGPKDEQGCFLCDDAVSDDERGRHILARSAHGIVVLNRYPYNGGHLMVAPLRHVAEPADLSPAERGEVMDLLGQCVEALKAEFKPAGFNLGANLGRVAGAGLPGHFHLHVVPRWEGDTNFMPILGEAKVIPEALEATYDRLRPRFD